MTAPTANELAPNAHAGDALALDALAGSAPGRWLPHGAGMVLLDRIEHCDGDGLRALSTRHRGPAHPLADTAGAVATLHLLEYAAQAAAIHLGVLRARADASGVPAAVAPGVIAFVRELWFGLPDIGPEAPALQVEVQRRAAIPGGVAYAFTARFAAGETAARGNHDANTAATDDEPPLARGLFGVVLAPAGLGAQGDDAPVPVAPASHARTSRAHASEAVASQVSAASDVALHGPRASSPGSQGEAPGAPGREVI